MHIEHFIGSNPLLASTSCTDPVNNLKNLQINTRQTPQIILNLTENNQQKTKIKSRSPSPFWIKDETSSYSEVVKTGYILSRNNSRDNSPKSKYDSEHINRNLNPHLSIKRGRSKSPTDKWKQDQLENNTVYHMPLEQVTTLPKESITMTTNVQNSKHIKRRSRSRRNRNSKNFDVKSVSNNDVIEIATTTENVMLDQSKFKNIIINPEIIVSDIKKQHSNNFEKIKCQHTPEPTPYAETCTQTDVLLDDSRAIFDQKPTSETTELLNTVGNFSKSQLSNNNYSNSCFDLNERLKGIFGSVDKKHYKHHFFDRPRSKSDTRDLGNLTQIFTNPNNNDKYTCRFERSAESVKNNSTTSNRRSFDNILFPFENIRVQMEQSDGTDNKQKKSVR